jgi:hypothetical protein
LPATHQQRTDNQNIQGALKTKLPPINEPVKTWASELSRTFSKEEIQMAKKHMKKMLTISGPKGNTNQNHTKILPHPSKTPTTVLVRMWGKRNPHTLLVGMQASATTLKKNTEAS